MSQEMEGRDSDCSTTAMASRRREFAQHIRADAMANYGSAGPAFVQQIIAAVRRDPSRSKNDLRDRIDAVQNEFLQEIADADGQVSRVARSFAAVAVAGEMAQETLHLPWNGDEPKTAASACFKAW